MTDFVAGAVSGGAGVLVGQPFDHAKVRIQQPHSSYRGMLDALRTIAAKEGFRKLFTGMTSPLSTVMLQNAVLFQSFKTSERMLQGTSPSSPSTVCAAGAMAGLCQSLVSAPVDLLKTLSQCGSGKGPYERGTDILRAQGVGGLYRTWGITAMRECPSFAVYFSVYHALVPRTPHAYDAHTSSQGTRLSSPLAASSFVAGGVAGVLAWWAVYPIDVLKSRAEASAGNRSVLAVATSMVREEGWRVAFKGIGAAGVRAFVVNSVIFTVYEGCAAVL